MMKALASRWWAPIYRVLVLVFLVLIYLEARDTNDTADQARLHAISAEEAAEGCAKPDN